MTERISYLMSQISLLEVELDAESARRRAQLRFGIERGRVEFEEETLRRHRDSQTPLWSYIRNARPSVALTGPVIYSLLVPLVALDVFVTLYQWICFPIYKIEKAHRSEFMIFDRHHLGYLNPIEKINCAFCSYATGLIAYVAEISSLTEQHWCPIKHARRLAATHQRYHDFADFGDAKGYVDRVGASTSHEKNQL